MDCILQNELNFLLPFFNSLNAAEVSDCSYLLVWIDVNEKKKKKISKKIVVLKSSKSDSLWNSDKLLIGRDSLCEVMREGRVRVD